MWGKLKNPRTHPTNGHRSDIRNEKQVAVHFNSLGHKLSSLTMEQMLNPNLHKRKENYCTHHCHPSRMNLEFACLQIVILFFLLTLHFIFFHLSFFFTCTLCIIMLFFSLIGHCFYLFAFP